MPPEQIDPRTRVHGFISAVSRRRGMLHVALSVAACGAAWLALSLGVFIAGKGDLVAALRLPAAVLGAVVAMSAAYRFRSRRASAAAIERAIPGCRNLIVTAEELERYEDRASPAMTRRVLVAADAALSGAKPGQVLPLRWILMPLAAGLAAAVLTTPLAQQAIRESTAVVTRALPSLSDAPQFQVLVEPPAYSGRRSETLDRPARLEVLAGSSLTFELRGQARVRFGDTPIQGTVVARASGYFAVDSEVEGAETPRVVLIPLSVTPDRAPTVRIVAPGKDLLLPSGNRTIPVTIHASDDLALDNLELRYTKVSGTGEQFEFEEGTLPVRLERTSAREWRASGALALATLRLGPGDSLVYRAVARDQRPNAAGDAASDTYFVEITGPGQVALEGVDRPSELERYAMSQAMIVLKIERLQAKAAGLPHKTLVEESAGLAAEQRTVRANFVFLLGGYVEDEVVEAEHSHEIQEGRLENTARKDIETAISQMTRAAEMLTALSPSGALPPARAAVESLQRAFGRSRYLLRALAVRSRLDRSRRLTGNLEEAGNWQRLPPNQDARVGDAVRHLLERLLDAAAALKAGQTVPPRTFEAMAESAMAIDSASPVWQEVARQLIGATDAAALQDIIARVAPEARTGALPRTSIAQPASSIQRALQAERRP